MLHQVLSAAGLFLLMSLLTSVTGFIGQSIPVTENQRAREIFHIADKDHDNRLSFQDVKVIFKDFDLDGNGNVNLAEFTKHWLDDRLGDVKSSVAMFNHLDTDNNNEFTFVPDMHRMFYYFDRNEDGFVSQAEFVIVWTKMSI